MRFLRFKITKRTYVTLLLSSFFVTLTIWALLSYTGSIDHLFLPSPTKVLSDTYNLFIEYGYARDIWRSVYRILWGFGLSVIIGVPLGIMMGINKFIEASVEPIVNFIRYMPVAGFIPLCILWLGIGDNQKTAIIFIGTFFQLVPMVMNETSSIPKEYLDTARTLGADDIYVIRRVVLPHCSPGIFDALRISLGIAWTYLIVAEIVAANSGIGHVVIEAQRYLKTSYIFVGILTVGFLGLLTDFAFKVARPLLFPWTTTMR